MIRPGFLAAAILLALQAVPAQAQQLSRTELEAALKQRDDVIAALQARVEALERAQSAPVQPGSAAPVQSLAATEAAPAVVKAEPEPGDEEQLAALSQTLLQSGGLVLAPWRFEAIPSFSYSNRIVQGLTLVETPEGIQTVADQRLRNDQFRGALALRLGLPLSSQIEVEVPYVWLRRSRAIGDGSSAVNAGSGIGDVEVALSHQFLRENDAHPGIVAGVSWRFRTGQDPFDARVPAVATGSGTNQLRARITAIKRSEPVVFFGTVSYAHELARVRDFGKVQTGDAYGLQLGMVLALSPDTTLTFGASQEFRSRTSLDGETIAGTDTVSSSFQIGVGQALSDKLLLDLSLGIGLTRDTPDYVFRLSLPFRF